jgi:hypothetical protein
VHWYRCSRSPASCRTLIRVLACRVSSPPTAVGRCLTSIDRGPRGSWWEYMGHSLAWRRCGWRCSRPAIGLPFSCLCWRGPRSVGSWPIAGHRVCSCCTCGERQLTSDSRPPLMRRSGVTPKMSRCNLTSFAAQRERYWCTSPRRRIICSSSGPVTVACCRAAGKDRPRATASRVPHVLSCSSRHPHSCTTPTD